MLVCSDMVPMSLLDLKAKTQTEAIATITASVCGTNCHKASTSKSFHALHLEAFSIHTQARNPSPSLLMCSPVTLGTLSNDAKGL